MDDNSSHLRRLDHEVLRELVEIKDNLSSEFSPKFKTFLGNLIAEESKTLKLPHCLFSGCKNTPVIKSHSVSRSAVLENVCDNKKEVVMPIMGNELLGKTPRWRRVNIQNVTVFYTLCSKCDQIFSPIDRDPDVNNKEHLFLLAYRSIYYKFYFSWVEFEKCRMVMKKIGEEITNQISLQNFILDENLLLWVNYYKRILNQLDDAYNRGDWSQIKHWTISLKNEHPTIAACDSFGIDDPELLHGFHTSTGSYQTLEPESRDPYQNIVNTALVTLNVFPKNNDVFVVLSSVLEDDPIVKHYWREIEKATEGYYQKYLISKFVLRNCGNLVLNPQHFNKMSQVKKDAILKYWEETHPYFYSSENSAKAVEIMRTENENLYIF